MPSPMNPKPAHADIRLLAEIKAALEAFERGDRNAFDTLGDVIVAVEAYRAVVRPPRKIA